MKNITKILILVIAILVCVLMTVLRPHKVVEKVVTKNDTVIVVKYDTVTKYVPKYVTKTVIDTLLLRDTVVLREQKHYSEKGLYDIWVSGYQPQLDSVKVFPKIVYKTITNTEIRYAETQEWRLYLGGGFNANLSAFMPYSTLTIETPQSTLISANLGYYNGLFYGITIQKEIKW